MLVPAPGSVHLTRMQMERGGRMSLQRIAGNTARDDPLLTRPRYSASAAEYSLVERAPERQKASSGRGNSWISCAKAAISSGDW